ncbi:MAG: VPLPA-CTERM sorting domain-containing protein [Desulfuromonadales bacterium]|nr:MAG: VPLPA-CTERM sorting domain-containing protein [Desulfuromonadales bacterium]
MNFLKIKLLVIALVVFASSSAFAALSYDVTVNTSAVSGTSGYMYLQYGGLNGADSTATVTNFSMTGNSAALGPIDSINVINNSTVTGTLLGSLGLGFVNTGGFAVYDYNRAITLGDSIHFTVSFNLATGGTDGGSSTFSLGLFRDATGGSPLYNITDPSIPGTVALINLFNDGTTTAQSLDSSTEVTPTPIPAAAWLLGSGLMGLAGIRRRKA